MALPKKAQGVLLRFFGVFSLIRGYNIAVLVVALYLTAHYILAPNVGLVELLLDLNLLFLVLASAATTASGYIINNFFDAAKDQINRPHKYLLEHLVSQQQQLVLYFILSLMALFFAGLVSIRAVLFFSAYIVAIALYSSVIKRLYWLSNIFAALLV
ncbi:MAG: UbiA family prenyltransferase, partial [Flavobacteriaceae bacterium]